MLKSRVRALVAAMVVMVAVMVDKLNQFCGKRLLHTDVVVDFVDSDAKEKRLLSNDWIRMLGNAMRQ